MNTNFYDIARKLTKTPKKDKGAEQPHIQGGKPNYIQQADILYLPSDKGFKYLLVVVDIASRLTDAIPLKNKTTTAVLNAFKKIYLKNNILEIPKRIDCDNGTEFKGSVKKWLNENGVYVRYGKAGRSRQQALAERRNQEIGEEILFNQLVKEIETNKVSKLWIHMIPNILSRLNKIHERDESIDTKKYDPLFKNKLNDGYIKGDKVRIVLDEPHDYFGKKQIGNFRTSDIRFSTKIYEIDKVLIRPNYPIMYLVKGLEHVPYTYNQLQKV
jgi:hypothetical protein